MRKLAYFFIILSVSLLSYAGGNPEHVSFPASYKTEYTQYDTRNRNNGKQLAMLYANNVAMNSVQNGKLADGSKIVMEVYKAKLDDNGNPIKNADGLIEKGKFAAVAVMEKRSDWNASFNAEERAGNWGFAIYKTDGTPKDNKLECAACHKPLTETDYMYSFSSLSKFAGKK